MSTTMFDRDPLGEPRRNTDRRTGRSIVPVVLLVGSLVALRGDLTGTETLVPRQRAAADSGLTLALLGLFAMSAVFILLSILGGRGHTKGSMPAEDARGARWRLGYVRRRHLLILAAVLGAAVILVGTIALFAPVARDALSPLWSDTSGQRSGDSDSQSDAGHDGVPGRDGDGSLFPLVAALAVVLSIGVTVVVFAARAADAHDGPDHAGADPVVEPGLLAHAAQIGIAKVSDPGRNPRAAIIACYAAMEHALAAAPDTAPAVSDTPSQVLARAVEHRVLPPRAAGALVELFTEARFSPHLMTEQHRELAVELLRIVQADLGTRQ